MRAEMASSRMMQHRSECVEGTPMQRRSRFTFRKCAARRDVASGFPISFGAIVSVNDLLTDCWADREGADADEDRSKLSSSAERACFCARCSAVRSVFCKDLPLHAKEPFSRWICSFCNYENISAKDKCDRFDQGMTESASKISYRDEVARVDAYYPCSKDPIESSASSFETNRYSHRELPLYIFVVDENIPKPSFAEICSSLSSALREVPENSLVAFVSFFSGSISIYETGAQCEDMQIVSDVFDGTDSPSKDVVDLIAAHESGADALSNASYVTPVHVAKKTISKIAAAVAESANRKRNPRRSVSSITVAVEYAIELCKVSEQTTGHVVVIFDGQMSSNVAHARNKTRGKTLERKFESLASREQTCNITLCAMCIGSGPAPGGNADADEANDEASAASLLTTFSRLAYRTCGFLRAYDPDTIAGRGTFAGDLRRVCGNGFTASLEVQSSSGLSIQRADGPGRPTRASASLVRFRLGIDGLGVGIMVRLLHDRDRLNTSAAYLQCRYVSRRGRSYMRVRTYRVPIARDAPEYLASMDPRVSSLAMARSSALRMCDGVPINEAAETLRRQIQACVEIFRQHRDGVDRGKIDEILSELRACARSLLSGPLLGPHLRNTSEFCCFLSLVVRSSIPSADRILFPRLYALQLHGDPSSLMSWRPFASDRAIAAYGDSLQLNGPYVFDDFERIYFHKADADTFRTVAMRRFPTAEAWEMNGREAQRLRWMYWRLPFLKRVCMSQRAI